MSSGISINGNTASRGATQINNVTNNFGLRDEDICIQECHQAFKTSTYEEYKDRNPPRIEGTCQWVLTHSRYCKWQQNQHNDLLWISADPGCGKSVLARSLVDRDLERGPDLVVCYFFFKDNDEQDNIATALCALLHQLFQQCIGLIRHALPAIGQNADKIRLETREMWRILQRAASDPSAPSIVCVLDALDECRHKDRDLLISLLQGILKPSSDNSARNTLKFLVTSRPYSDVERGFRPLTSCWPEIRLRGEEENVHIHREIDLVVRVRARELAVEFELSQASRERLEKQLLDMQHRTYLWLYLAMDEIHAKYESSLYPDEVTIDTLPVSVEEAYERILQKVDRRQVDIARQVLLIITGARRPLKIAELALALSAASAYQKGSKRLPPVNVSHLKQQIPQWCGLFVYKQHDSFFLIHQTAKEFLLADPANVQSGANLWCGSLTPIYIEEEMAKLCTKYLIAAQSPASDHQGSGGDSELAPQRGSTDSKDPQKEFFEYCAQYWFLHCNDQVICAERGLLDVVLTLYDTSSDLFSRWSRIWWGPTEWRLRVPAFTTQQLAATNGHTSVLAYLDEHSKIEYEALSGDGRSMLHWAVWNGHLNTVSWLIDKGAGVNLRTRDGWTALSEAVYYGQTEIAELLLARPDIEVNIQDKNGWTALYRAVFEEQTEIVKLLLARPDIEVNIQDKNGWTALYKAVYYGQTEMVKLLSARPDVDVNIQDEDGDTVLHKAAFYGRTKIAKLLLDRSDVDVNIQDEDGDTALYNAVYRQQTQIVKLLLARPDIDLDMYDWKYERLLKLAEEDQEVAQLLRDR